jgi:hypothetical protein
MWGRVWHSGEVVGTPRRWCRMENIEAIRVILGITEENKVILGISEDT